MSKKFFVSVIVTIFLFYLFADNTVQAACRHKNYRDYYTKTRYVQYSSSRHDAVPFYKRKCSKCGKIIKREVKGAKTREVHTFSSKKCTKCGYEKNSNTYNNTLSGNNSSNNYINSSTSTIENHNTFITEIPKVTYNYNTHGQYIFVNNPEAIHADDFMENSKHWLYSTAFQGRTKMFLEQTAYDIPYTYYGIQIYNHNSSDAYLKLKNAAVALNDNSFTSVWNTYESNIGFSGEITKKNSEITIPAYSSIWLFPDGNNGFGVVKSKWSFEATHDGYSGKYMRINTSIEALLEVESDRMLYMNFAAFLDDTTVNPDYAYYTANKATRTDGISSHVYSGTGSRYPLAETNLKFTINDNSIGKLHVKVDNGEEADHWETFNSHKGYDINQILPSSIYPLEIPMVYKGNEKQVFYNHIAKNALDPRDNSVYNWADYGVTYQQNITVTNIGTKSRIVAYRIYWDQEERTVLYHDKYGFLHTERTKSAYSNDIRTITVPVGSTITFSADVTLGGMSNGIVSHTVVVY